MLRGTRVAFPVNSPSEGLQWGLKVRWGASRVLLLQGLMPTGRVQSLMIRIKGSGPFLSGEASPLPISLDFYAEEKHWWGGVETVEEGTAAERQTTEPQVKETKTNL